MQTYHHLELSKGKNTIFINTMQDKFSENFKKMSEDLEHLQNFVRFFPKPQITNAALALGIHVSSLSQYLAKDISKRVPIGAKLREQMRNAGYDFETGAMREQGGGNAAMLGYSATGNAVSLAAQSTGNAVSFYTPTEEEKQILQVLESYGIYTAEQLQKVLEITDTAADIFGSLSKLQQFKVLTQRKENL